MIFLHRMQRKLHATFQCTFFPNIFPHEEMDFSEQEIIKYLNVIF